jgi:hypothetical protein
MTQYRRPKTPTEIARNRIRAIGFLVFIVLLVFSPVFLLPLIHLPVELMAIGYGIGLVGVMFVATTASLERVNGFWTAFQPETSSENTSTPKTPTQLTIEYVARIHHYIALVALMCFVVSINSWQTAPYVMLMFGSSLCFSTVISVVSMWFGWRQGRIRKQLQHDAPPSQDVAVPTPLPERYVIGDDGEIIDLEANQKRAEKPKQR